MSLDVYLLEKHCSHCGRGDEIYDNNITHNLGKMAAEAGLYKALWRPDENGITTAQQLADAIEPGLADLKARPDHYKQFNAENNWGSYEDLVRFTEAYLDACREYPEALVRVSR